MVTCGATWCTTTTLSPPIPPAHHHWAPQGSRAEGSFPLPPSPAEGCCAHCQTVPLPQDSFQLDQAGWVLANLYQLAAGSIPAIGTGLMKCQSAALPIDPRSSVLQMSYCLCILPEMIKRRKQPSVLPGSPEGETLLGRDRQIQLKASR